MAAGRGDRVCAAWYWFGMSVTGYFGKRTAAVETSWERDARQEMLRVAGLLPLNWASGVRMPAALDVHERKEDCDPALRAVTTVCTRFKAPGISVLRGIGRVDKGGTHGKYSA